MISKSNIKEIRSLGQKKFRDQLEIYVLEGEKMVHEALSWIPNELVHVYHTAEFWNEKFASNSIPHTEISEKELNQISFLQTPNKALALIRKPKQVIKPADFFLVLDEVQDPGNMGTILRLADWFGVSQLICSKGTVDCFNPKVVQATMGAIFRIPVHYVDLASWLDAQTLPIYGALLEGENVYSQKLNPHGILILGNEGKGITKEIQQKITHPISIPRFGSAESLNVSMAGSILLSEFYRIATH